MYSVVDPSTWLDARWLSEVTSCSANWDADTATLSSASIELSDDIPPECYVRAYCEATQDGVTERFAIGTWLVQTPSKSSDNTKRTVSCDAYSPLLELQDQQPPIGWCADGSIDDAIVDVCSHMRAPLVVNATGVTLPSQVVAADGDTWLDILWALCDAAGIEVAIDGMGRVVPRPRVVPWALNPSMTLDDRGERGILSADATEETDLFDIPNRMEVVVSDSNRSISGFFVNDDPASPVSTVSRGRVVSRRETNPDGLMAGCTQAQAVEFAERLLREASVLTKTWTVKMGFVPLSLGSCVRLRHSLLEVDETATVTKIGMDLDVAAEMELTLSSTREVW